MVELEIEFIKMLVISALAGGLLGVEREYRATVIAGTRTFMLFSMLGAVGVYLSGQLSFSFLDYLLLGAVFMVLLLGVIKNFKTSDIGLTTVTAFFLSFLLGTMVGLGHYLEAISASIIITAILISKKYSQMLSQALEHDEMRAAIEFGIVVFVLYPVVPYSPPGPLGIFSPQILLTAIIAVTTIGFASFLALRFFSSYFSAVVRASLGALVHYQQTVQSLLQVRNFSSIALATSAMFLRNLVVVGLISFTLLEELLIPTLAMVATGILFSLGGRKKAREVELDLSIPFAITPAVIFALYYSAFTLVAFLLRDQPVVFPAFSLLAGIPFSVAMVSSLATLVALGEVGVEMAALSGVLALLGSSLKALFFSRKERELFYPLLALFILSAAVSLGLLTYL